MSFAANQFKPVEYPGFGRGLNLRDQPDVVAPDQALDCLNVLFTERGAVKQRPGFDKWTAAAAASPYDSLLAFYTASGTKQLVGGAGDSLRALNSAGVLVSAQATASSPHSMTRFGDPAAELLFAANGAEDIWQWDGAAWTQPVSTTGKYVANYEKSNRLVNANFSGTTEGDNPSTVSFSEAGDPLTFSGNTIDLMPGDGEEIMGVCQWRELFFVFKETKFFVFYGESEISTGQVEFLYRPISSGRGLVAPHAFAVANDGVYFLDRTGVYRTTGSEPALVSDALSGVFDQLVTPTFYSGSAVNYPHITNAQMAFVSDRIYLALPTLLTTNDRLFVFSTIDGWWSVHDIPAASLTAFRPGNTTDLMFGYAVGTKDIGRHYSGPVTDAGTNINSFWRGGWWNHQINGVHTLRQIILSGIGHCTTNYAVDFQGAGVAQDANFNQGVDFWADGSDPSDLWADGSDSSDMWGAGAVIQQRMINGAAYRGGVYSLHFDSLSGAPWEIHAATAQLRELVPYLV